jgi:hypothetical protein
LLRRTKNLICKALRAIRIGAVRARLTTEKGTEVLYTAVLVACLASAPGASSQGDCRTHEMLINAGANPISAYVEAQTRAAEWLSQHPELAQHSLTIHPGRAA